MTLANVPGLRQARSAVRRLRPLGSSASYWERRYRAGGTSGDGSYGDNARMKADVVNEIVRSNDVRSIVELGCGDGNQLSLLDIASYVGLDVSATAIDICAERFTDDASKSFFWYDPAHFFDRGRALARDLALSQEVIFHLVEDEVFEQYMRHLFGAADKLVLICSSNHDQNQNKHLRHRVFTDWVTAHQPEWSLLEKIPSPRPYDPATGTGLMADFYLYQRAVS